MKLLARETSFKNETGTHSKRRQMQRDTGTSSVIEGDEKHRCAVAGLHRLTPNTFKVQSSLGDFRDTPTHPAVGRGQDAIQTGFQTCSSNLCASTNRRSRMDRKSVEWVTENLAIYLKGIGEGILSLVLVQSPQLPSLLLLLLLGWLFLFSYFQVWRCFFARKHKSRKL